MRAPPFMTCYRRLLGDTYWTAAQGPPDRSELHMECITGCPDDVILAIAEISTLADWKTQEQLRGSLSVRELVRRANGIEQQLRAYQDPTLLIENRPPHQCSSPGCTGCAETSAFVQAPAHPAGLFPGGDEPQGEGARRLVGNLFRETAVLYLHTVTSGPNPGTCSP